MERRVRVTMIGHFTITEKMLEPDPDGFYGTDKPATWDEAIEIDRANIASNMVSPWELLDEDPETTLEFEDGGA